MIVAPLTLPIMGLAMSIGDRARILNALLFSLAGIVMAVAVGFLLTLPVAGCCSLGASRRSWGARRRVCSI